jgi:hypothetical protein
VNARDLESNCGVRFISLTQRREEVEVAAITGVLQVSTLSSVVGAPPSFPGTRTAWAAAQPDWRRGWHGGASAEKGLRRCHRRNAKNVLIFRSKRMHIHTAVAGLYNMVSRYWID